MTDSSDSIPTPPITNEGGTTPVVLSAVDDNDDVAEPNADAEESPEASDRADEVIPTPVDLSESNDADAKSASYTNAAVANCMDLTATDESDAKAVVHAHPAYPTPVDPNAAANNGMIPETNALSPPTPVFNGTEKEEVAAKSTENAVHPAPVDLTAEGDQNVEAVAHANAVYPAPVDLSAAAEDNPAAIIHANAVYPTPVDLMAAGKGMGTTTAVIQPHAVYPTPVDLGNKSSQVAMSMPRAKSSMCPTTAPMLRDGRVMAPTFQEGEVMCHDVATTSVRLTWSKPSDKTYPVYAYRVCTAEVGHGFEVTNAEAPSSSTECVIVGLRPGKIYQFHVASISAEKMIVPGSSVVSKPVQLPEAKYERAWFFEGSGDDQDWMVFEGLGPDYVGPVDTGAGSTALDDIRCSPSPIRCYSGVRSLCLVSPAGLAGGAFVDTPVKEGWLYVLKARVYHEDPFVLIGSKSSNIPEEAAATCGARLVLWDKQDGKVISEPATKSGEWELLECQIVPFRSETLRIAVQTSSEYRGNVYIDAVELYHGGPTPAELAVSSVTSVMDETRPTPSKVQIVVESARDLQASDTIGKSDPFVKVYVGDVEVHRTQVVPMTLSPFWGETFVFPPGSGATNGSEHSLVKNGNLAEGVRFEVWDHDFHGEGDYLGEVRCTAAELAAAPPHRVERKMVTHKPHTRERHAEGPPPKERHAHADQSGTGDGAGRIGAKGGPGFLAFALLVSWPEDADSAEGKLVTSLQNEQNVFPVRLKALQDLSFAALKEPRNIEDAAKIKARLLRARAPEAAVWNLCEPLFLEDACHVLTGLIKLGRDVGHTEAGFDLCRRLQRYVLLMSPAVVAVRCLRASIGRPEVLLDLLEKLYAGQQATLHEDVVNVPGFFYSLVTHVEGMVPAQAIMREISGGCRDLSPELIALFRRYRTRIPPLAGLWRTTVLQRLAGEEARPPDAEMDDLEAADEDAGGRHSTSPQKMGYHCHLPLREQTCGTIFRANTVVFLAAIPPLCMAMIGGGLVGSKGSCEQPVATLVLVDGLLLLSAAVGGGCFQANRRRFSALAGRWLFPVMFAVFLTHVAVTGGLLVSIARVDRIDSNSDGGADDGNSTVCSMSTFVWGVGILVLDLFCVAAPPVVQCVRCWDRATKTAPMLVVPDEKYHTRKYSDKAPAAENV